MPLGYAEFVAFGVGHGDPTVRALVAVPELGGTAGDELCDDFGVVLLPDAEVEVHLVVPAMRPWLSGC